MFDGMFDQTIILDTKYKFQIEHDTAFVKKMIVSLNFFSYTIGVVEHKLQG